MGWNYSFNDKGEDMKNNIKNEVRGIDIEKVKKGLKCCSTLMDKSCTSEDQDNACNVCPYGANERCSWGLDKDALTLINELEKGNEALSFAVKQGFNDCQTKTLKQFAKRLKEYIEHHHGNYGDLSDSECNDIIDETLKEFIDEQD